MKLLRVHETAERLEMSQSEIYRLCAERRLPHVRIGCGRGAIRIRESDLEEFIRSCRVERFPLDEDDLDDSDDLEDS
jgi:excisionase family DNA binding protein